jgi:hypothetical protein
MTRISWIWRKRQTTKRRGERISYQLATGSYIKAGHPRLIRVDFHGAKEVPTGTCHAILKAAGLKRK